MVENLIKKREVIHVPKKASALYQLTQLSDGQDFFQASEPSGSEEEAFFKYFC